MSITGIGSVTRKRIPAENRDPEADLAAASKCRSVVVTAWIALAIALIVKSIVVPTKHTTYPVYEAAGRCWRMNSNMYSLEVCGEDFRYSPTFAAAIAPLSRFPAAIGGILWNLANLGFIGWALSQFVRYVVPERWTVQQRMLFTLLALGAFGRTLWSGQTNALISAFVIGSAAAIVRGRWWSAAFLLAAPVYIKVWPVACAMLFAWQEPRRLAGRFATALMALGSVPFLLKGPSQAWAYYRAWIEGIAGPFQHRHDYHDLWAVWDSMAAPVEPFAYRIVCATAALGVLLVTLWHARSAPGPRPLTLLGLGLWMCWQLIFGPATERNTYSLIAPLTSWAVIDSLSRRRNQLWACSCYAMITCFSYGGLAGIVVRVVPYAADLLPVVAMAFTGLLIATGCGCQDQRTDEQILPPMLLQQTADTWWQTLPPVRWKSDRFGGPGSIVDVNSISNQLPSGSQQGQRVLVG